MADKILKLDNENRLVAEDPDTGETEPISFEEFDAVLANFDEQPDGAIQNAVYESEADIPQEHEVDGRMVFTKDEGLIVFEEAE